jgi:hypothetical protein
LEELEVVGGDGEAQATEKRRASSTCNILGSVDQKSTAPADRSLVNQKASVNTRQLSGFMSLLID